jgi:hypothetical protein
MPSTAAKGITKVFWIELSGNDYYAGYRSITQAGTFEHDHPSVFYRTEVDS